MGETLLSCPSTAADVTHLAGNTERSKQHEGGAFIVMLEVCMKFLGV